MRSLILLIVSFVFVSCSTELTPKENKFGGNFRLIHIGTDPKTLNPWIANDASSAGFAGILFLGLTETDPETDQIKPLLAQSFKIEDSGKKITVILRDDIFWTDGEKITVDDVVFTWNTLIRDQIAISSLKDILSIDGKFPEVTKIDDRTLVFTTIKTFAPFLRYLGTEIAPKHHIEKYFKDNQADSFDEMQKIFNNYLNLDTEPKNIVSSGAFKLKKIRPGQEIYFTRNENFFLKDSSGLALPYVDNLIYVYSRDESSAIFRFFAGEVQSIGVSPDNAGLVKSLEKRYNYTLYNTGATSSTNFLWFNLSKNIPEPKYSWFNNRDFRQAVSFAIDRQSIVNNVFAGLAQPLFLPESPRSPFVNQLLINGYSRDLTKAKELLMNAGFKFSADKKLFDAAGNRVEFDLFTNASNPERELMGVIIKSNLEELGMKVNFKILEFNNFVGRVTQGKDYEAGLIALTGGNEPNDGGNVWRSKGRLHLFDVKEFQSEPITRDWELELDEIFDAGVSTLDFNQRKVFYDRYQEIVYREIPLIYLCSPESISAIKNNVGNVKLTRYGGLMPKIYEVFLK